MFRFFVIARRNHYDHAFLWIASSLHFVTLLAMTTLLRQSRRGFTAVEFLVAVAIVLLVSGVVSSSFANIRMQKLLDTESGAVASLLEDARSRTLASVGGSSYGVHLESGAATLFKGTIYTAGAADNEVRPLDARVRIADIALAGGGADIVFARLSGDVVASGTFEVEWASDSSAVRRITVESSGFVAGGEI